MATRRTPRESTRAALQLIPARATKTDRKRDSLFSALEGSRLRLGRREYALEVYSITDQIAGRWVQIGFRNASTDTIMLCLPRQAGFQQARAALLQLLAEQPQFCMQRHEAA